MCVCVRDVVNGRERVELCILYRRELLVSCRRDVVGLCKCREREQIIKRETRDDHTRTRRSALEKKSSGRREYEARRDREVARRRGGLQSPEGFHPRDRTCYPRRRAALHAPRPAVRANLCPPVDAKPTVVGIRNVSLRGRHGRSAGQASARQLWESACAPPTIVAPTANTRGVGAGRRPRALPSFAWAVHRSVQVSPAALTARVGGGPGGHGCCRGCYGCDCAARRAAAA